MKKRAKYDFQKIKERVIPLVYYPKNEIEELEKLCDEKNEIEIKIREAIRKIDLINSDKILKDEKNMKICSYEIRQIMKEVDKNHNKYLAHPMFKEGVRQFKNYNIQKEEYINHANLSTCN